MVKWCKVEKLQLHTAFIQVDGSLLDYMVFIIWYVSSLYVSSLIFITVFPFMNERVERWMLFQLESCFNPCSRLFSYALRPFFYSSSLFSSLSPLLSSLLPPLSPLSLRRSRGLRSLRATKTGWRRSPEHSKLTLTLTLEGKGLQTHTTQKGLAREGASKGTLGDLNHLRRAYKKRLGENMGEYIDER